MPRTPKDGTGGKKKSGKASKPARTTIADQVFRDEDELDDDASPPPRSGAARDIEQYQHPDKKRKNNPPVGLVTPETDVDGGKRMYEYDPHLDPSLVWAGKVERTKIEIQTVSLHVHERIDPRTVIESVRRKTDQSEQPETYQPSLFDTPEERPPLRKAIDFYKHDHGWSNRLIAGDSLLVMNSLLEKEGMAGKVQTIYFDPPYGIKYGSNFQPFVNKREVKDKKDADLNQEPEMIKAFRDTWELGIHSYLSYMRDRLLLSREMLTDEGSIFVQISSENLHHVREIMDEVFGPTNFVSLITFQTTSGFEGSKTLSRLGDYLLWYAKDISKVKFRCLYEKREIVPGTGNATWILLPDGTYRGVSKAEARGEEKIPAGSRLYFPDNMQSQGAASEPQPFKFNEETYYPNPNSHWKPRYPDGLQRLAKEGRIHKAKNSVRYRRFAEDFPYVMRGNIWSDTQTGSFTEAKVYVVQTNTKVVERCILLSTDPGDLVFDLTCGSGTTALMAERWGRRWITCDTSRIATALAKQRLITTSFEYFNLAHPVEGVGSGFKYKTVPHITLKSVSRGEPPEQEVLYDQPEFDESRVRVTGPFTVEAVPAPTVTALTTTDESAGASNPAAGPSSFGKRVKEWCDELLHCGVRSKQGALISFSRVEILSGTKWLHAEAETKEDEPKKVVISFGSEFSPLEQRQVELAIEEARKFSAKPQMMIFAAFQYDPEAAKDIDETIWSGLTLLKVQMNTDLLTEDLKKKRSSNESFWLMGQPDVEIRPAKSGIKGKFEVEVHGFDYFNTKTGIIESGDTTRIAMWLLDTDYDGRSLLPRQIFFPMAGAKGGWAKIAKSLRAEIDETLIQFYQGATSLPFSIGVNRRVAVKIVDDRGIESLKVLEVEK